MNFKELKDLLYWVCDDGTNADDLLFLKDGHDGVLINEALMDLADCLNIIRYTGTLAPDVSGVVVLPPDFKDAVRLRWDTVDLTPIDSIHDAAVGTGAVVQYMITGNKKAQLYDVPSEPYSVLHLWYRAYPPKLVDDSDEPSDVPEEYHKALALIYGRAMFHYKLGDMQQYQQLMPLWELAKKAVRGTTEARAWQSDMPKRWRW